MKPLSESLLFHGMRRATEKRPSEMTKDEMSVAVALMTTEEKHTFVNRLGSLCGTSEPTMQQTEMAWDDMLTIRNEVEA